MVMAFHLLDEYPGDAAGGCDYLSRAPRGDIVEQGPDGPVVRPERVVVTDVSIDFEGRLCIGERTARQLAREFGMVDGWQVERLRDHAQGVLDERDLLSRELADAREQVANLLEMQREQTVEVYIGLDGARHASAGAAEDASRKKRGRGPKALTETAVVDNPVDKTGAGIKNEQVTCAVLFGNPGTSDRTRCSLVEGHSGPHAHIVVDHSAEVAAK